MKTARSYYFFIFIFLLFLPLVQLAQTTKRKAIVDTASVNRLEREATSYLKKGQLDEAMVYIIKIKQLAKKIGYKQGLARSYTDEGTILYRKGKYLEAIDCASTGLMIGQLISDSIIIVNSYNCIGNAYAYMGNQIKAMEYYFKGLNIEEKLKIQNNIQWFYNNIGNLYTEQKNYPKALEYSFKAIKIEEKKKDKRALAVTLSNIGNAYLSMQKNDSALFYFLRATKTGEEAKDTFALALGMTNSAIAFCVLKQYNSGYNYATKAYKISKGKGFKELITYNLTNLGNVYQGFKKYDIAEKYLLEAESEAKKIDAKLLIKDGFLELADLYDEEKNYQKAYDYYKLFSEAKDSMLNQENSKLITEMNTKYTTEKKEKEIELLKKNEDIQNLELSKKKNELSRQRTVSIGIFVGFLLLMIVAVLMYSRFRLKKKANEQLQNAFNLIEEKNTQIEKSNLMITDSITYAKRIQDAILPAPEELSKNLSNDFFIFYKPSQIVSGDFYWCSAQGDKTIFVVADCTGHGVPGAFMSMIGNTLLNEIVNERKITSTQKIAELLDKKIIRSLHQHEGTEKYDGMDISICCIDKLTKEISFTGAHHSMYTYNGHLSKIKGDPFSIGGAQQQKNKTFSPTASFNTKRAFASTS